MSKNEMLNVGKNEKKEELDLIDELDVKELELDDLDDEAELEEDLSLDNLSTLDDDEEETGDDEEDVEADDEDDMQEDPADESDEIMDEEEDDDDIEPEEADEDDDPADTFEDDDLEETEEAGEDEIPEEEQITEDEQEIIAEDDQTKAIAVEANNEPVKPEHKSAGKPKKAQKSTAKPATSEKSEKGVSPIKNRKVMEETIMAEATEPEVKVEKQQKKRPQRIHTINGTLRVETEDVRRQKEKVDLSESMHTKSPIIGKLHHCEETNMGVVGVVMYGKTRVLIPVDHLIDLGTPETVNERGVEMYRPVKDKDFLVEKDKYAKDELKKRLRMEVDYIVKGMVEDETNPDKFSFVASRKEAMKAKRRLNYYPDNLGYLQLDVGDITEGRVVSVGTKAITVEIEGVETLIRAEELTYRHIASYTPSYKVGDIVLCVITGIEFGNKKDREVKISASVKQTFENPIKEEISTFKKGSIYDGKVSYIYEKGIFVEITDDIDCYCHFPTFIDRPVLGSHVKVEIERVDLNKFKLQGKIRK